MLKKLLLLLIIASPCLAQNVRKDDVAMQLVTQNTSAGTVSFLKPVPGAVITVCSATGSGLPCTPLASPGICSSSSDAVCTQPNPTNADANGNYGFWVQPGRYVVSITGVGVTGKLITYDLPIGQTNGNTASATQLQSTVPTGTPPLVVASTTLVPNLNAASSGTTTNATNLVGPGTISGTYASTGTLNCTIVNAIRCVSDTNPQGWAGTTPDAWITSAMTNCPTTGCEIDLSLSAPTFAAAVVYPSTKIIKLRWTTPTLITGPSSGGTVVDMSSAPDGSAWTGFSVGSYDLTGTSYGTKITMASAGVGFKVGKGSPRQNGVIVENTIINCASLAASVGFQIDTVTHSEFMNLSAGNCPAQGFHEQISSTNAGDNNMFNHWVMISGYNDGVGMQMDGNATGGGNSTQERYQDLHFAYIGTAGILCNACDNDRFSGYTGFRLSGTGNPMVFATSSGLITGGQNNYVDGVTGGVSGVITVIFQDQTRGNIITGCDTVNGEICAGNATNNPMQGTSQAMMDGSNLCGPTACGPTPGGGTNPVHILYQMANSGSNGNPFLLGATIGGAITNNWSNSGGETNFINSQGGGTRGGFEFDEATSCPACVRNNMGEIIPNSTTNSQWLTPDGTISLPSRSFINQTSLGFWRRTTDTIGVVDNGIEFFDLVGGSNIGVGSNLPINFSSGSLSSVGADTSFSRSAAGVLQIGNSGAAGSGGGLKLSSIFMPTNLLISATAPTIAAGGCGGTVAAIQNANGTASFDIFTGTAPTSAGCTITLPAAAHHWHCEANHTSAISTTNFIIQQTDNGASTTSVTLQLFSDVAAATAPTASDTWRTTCTAN